VTARFDETARVLARLSLQGAQATGESEERMTANEETEGSPQSETPGTPATPKLAADLLLVMAAAGRTERYPAGDLVFREGTVPEGFYLIVSGEVDVSRRDGRGMGWRVAKLGPGDYFGEIGLLTEDRRTATVRATTDLEVVVLDRGQFDKIVSISAPTAAQLEEVMSGRLAHDPDM
jgi:CRP-like cAMP-binding protein